MQDLFAGNCEEFRIYFLKCLQRVARLRDRTLAVNARKGERDISVILEKTCFL